MGGKSPENWRGTATGFYTRRVEAGLLMSRANQGPDAHGRAAGSVFNGKSAFFEVKVPTPIAAEQSDR